MVIVLVGDQHGVQRRWLQAQPRQSPHGFGGTETTIQHDAGIAGFNDQRIAFAAAA